VKENFCGRWYVDVSSNGNGLVFRTMLFDPKRYGCYNYYYYFLQHPIAELGQGL
jgi:hypothetical protein